jgi:hypothetical protein
MELQPRLRSSRPARGALAGQRVVPAWNCRRGSAPAGQRVKVQGKGDEERLLATAAGSPPEDGLAVVAGGISGDLQEDGRWRRQ